MSWHTGGGSSATGTGGRGERIRGRVKDWNAEKGFGFIHTLDADYFCHHSAIQGDGYKSLRDNEEVEFEVETNPSNGKLQVVNLTGPGGAPVKGGDRPSGKSKGKGWGKGQSEDRVRPEPDGRTVFVSGLSWDVGTEELKVFASQVGEVTYAAVFLDRETGKTKGCGKVQYETPALAEEAVEELNGKQLQGREVSARMMDDQPRGAPQEGGGGKGRGRGGGGKGTRQGPKPNSVFVSGLSWTTTDEGFREHFDQMGEVTDAYIVKDRETGKSRGFGKVAFATAAEQERAIEALHESDLDGRTITVRQDNPPPQRDDGAAAPAGWSPAGASSWSNFSSAGAGSDGAANTGAGGRWGASSPSWAGPSWPDSAPPPEEQAPAEEQRRTLAEESGEASGERAATRDDASGEREESSARAFAAEEEAPVLPPSGANDQGEREESSARGCAAEEEAPVLPPSGADDQDVGAGEEATGSAAVASGGGWSSGDWSQGWSSSGGWGSGSGWGAQGGAWGSASWEGGGGAGQVAVSDADGGAA